jgi:two-component system, sensor histidine kinase and response regulator
MNDDIQGPASGLLHEVRPEPGLTDDQPGSLPEAVGPMTCVFDPVGEIESLLEDSAVRAHLAGLELVSKVCSGLPRSILGDAGRLRQVLSGLIDNAIRFTPHGEIVVEAKQAREPSGEGPALFFQVRDTGRGMSLDQLSEVFLKPEGPGSTLRRMKQLVADLGGRLDIESIPDQGSTFRFTARFGPVKDGPVIRSLQPPAHLVGLRVLVADDNSTSRGVLAELLRSWGLHPTLVDGGQAALDILTRDEPHRSFEVLLLDARMPRLGGYTVTERLVEAGHWPRVVMLISPPCRRNDERACERLRIRERVPKPIRREQLLRALARATVGL